MAGCFYGRVAGISNFSRREIISPTSRTMSAILARGSKAQVFHGTARRTPGGLTKKDLMKHHGRIISRKKHLAGKKAIKHLFALGFRPKKGKFTLMRKSMAKAPKSKTRKARRS